VHSAIIAKIHRYWPMSLSNIIENIEKVDTIKNSPNITGKYRDTIYIMYKG